MKPKNKNYICIEDCGRLNPNTKKVAKSDKPLKLDLLTVRKTKRENVQNDLNDSITSVTTINILKEMTNEELTKKLLIKADIPIEVDDKVTKKKDVLNEMNDNVPKKQGVPNSYHQKRKKVFNKVNEGLHSPTKVMKQDIVNEISGNQLKRVNLLKVMNEDLHFPEVVTKEDVLNEINESDLKRENFLNEMYEGLNLPTKITQTEEVLNESDAYREKILNEINGGLNLPTKVTQTDEVVNESNPKRAKILNEMNEGLNLPTGVMQKEEVVNEINERDPKRERDLNEMNEFNLPTKVTKTEVLNDVLPPIEEDISLSNIGGDEYVLVSIERTRPLLKLDKNKKQMRIQVNSRHEVKSRGLKKGRNQNNMNFVEKRFLFKPIVA